MTLRKLQNTILTPAFFTHQVQKLFCNEKPYQINIALARMVKRGDLVRIKKGLFRFLEREIDEFTLATLMYQPSYISLESALHVYGMIPEEVMQVTSVTPITTKKLNTGEGIFLYSKIQSTLFFGYNKLQDSNSWLFYHLAKPEKALLDYIYVRRVKDLSSFRVDLSEIDRRLLFKYAREFPAWVQNITKEQL
ncbi:hypothetical protein KKE34_02045 [Patescibacteria group bacterium]|nr:hypothetical protein [Patescibacteria group bacterium]MBU1885367.1 hypothetical protein [Patescibacteria group bacterium]